MLDKNQFEFSSYTNNFVLKKTHKKSLILRLNFNKNEDDGMLNIHSPFFDNNVVVLQVAPFGDKYAFVEIVGKEYFEEEE